MRKSFLSSMVLVASLYGVPSCIDDGEGQSADSTATPAGAVDNNEAMLTGDTDAVALGAKRDQERTLELGSSVADISKSAFDPIVVAPDGSSTDGHGHGHGGVCDHGDCDDHGHGHGHGHD